MVSLKSFKPIDEVERDTTTTTSGASNILTDVGQARNLQFIGNQSHRHQYEHQVHKLVNRVGSNSSNRSNNNNSNNNNNISINDNHENTASKYSNKLRQTSNKMTADHDNKTMVSVSLPQGAAGTGNIERVSPSSSSISIVVVQHDNNGPIMRNFSSSLAASASDIDTQEDMSNKSIDTLEEAATATTASTRDDINGLNVEGGNIIEVPKLQQIAGVQGMMATNNNNNQNQFNTNLQIYQQQDMGRSCKSLAVPKRCNPMGGSNHKTEMETIGGDHFEIVWSNLSYRIEPKWYKKIDFLDRALSYLMPGQTVDNHSSATSTASSSAGMNDNQHQMHTSTNNVDSHLNNPIKMKSPTDPIEIFTNLNGTIKSGQMTAVLGPSGAGKTTLLNCLTGKLRNGVSGHINLKGANGKHLKMCTIPQKDHLLELLNVEENLWFASKIKNPEYGFDHAKNIERVIDLLGLKRCRSAKIKKISGGQHKRVSIAQELLSNPDILVLDEPTSGLDSLTCFKTISMLRDLVELSASNDFMKPMAIIVTIHQPQPKVFNLFHHVYILANGGHVIYEGAPDLSVDTITSVTGLQPGGSLDATSAQNAKAIAAASLNQVGGVDPASFLIEIASEEYGTEIITTLNNYQRRVFYEINHSNYNQLRDGPCAERFSPKIGARENHGFVSTDEDDSTIVNSKELASNKTTTPSSKISSDDIESNNINGNIINNSSKLVSHSSPNSPSANQIKRRKKSAYSLDSGTSLDFQSINNGSSVGNLASSHNQQQLQQHPSSKSISESSLYMSEQLLYTRVSNHEGRFWSHTATLAHRTLLTIRRDPLLMTSRVLFHLMIPLLMSYVYGRATGAANACPHYEPEIDITQIPSLVEGKRIEYMLEELHMSIENVSMFFIIMYAFAAAVLALNALSFPLNMQVLLKETRNGWYSMSSYVLAKTLADLPLELAMPSLTMAMVYLLTGQPSSYMGWRMLTICLIMTLCSLIAQTQALILGALVMSSVQTAVFVSQASQLPWVILAGFTIRIKRLSEPLKLISLTSFYRLGCEAITLARYGFGICPCNPEEITGEPVRLVGIPDQLRNVANYWLESMEASKASNNETLVADDDESSSSLITTTLAPVIQATTGGRNKADIFQHLANQLSYANSYGVNITSCDDVAPDRIRAINLSDNWLVARIWHLFIMLIIMKILLYYAVKFSIGIRL